MNRVLTVILIFFLGAVAALLLLGYFAYVITAGPPEEARVAGLSQPVEIGFTADGTVTVDASSLQDAMAGLGFAQAASHIWPLIVYRASATGQLAALVGGSGGSVDELTIQLGLARSAERAYLLLGEEDRKLLDSFADGINEALESRSVLRDPSLVLSGHNPASWMPWHTIAIERMFAWLAASERPQLSHEPLERPIKDFLRLHGFEESMIVTSERPSEPGIFVRYVWGSSALPVLLEASIRVGNNRPLRGGCMVGTPFFAAARSGDRAWAFLPHDDIETEVLHLDSVSVERRQEVLVGADESELLVTIVTAGKALILKEVTDGPQAKTGVAVTWGGLGPVTDASSWLGMIRGQVPEFRLTTGAGAIVYDEARAEYFGGNGRPLTRGRVFGRSLFSEYASVRIDSLMESSTSFNPRLWFGDTYSPWATIWSPRIVQSFASLDVMDAPVDEARSYLRNWDNEFDGASIGASIFAAWAEEYYIEYGGWPGMLDSGSESATLDPVATPSDLNRLFERAVHRLTETYGYDLSVWRWEKVNAAKMYFPVLGTPEGSSEAADRSRYAARTVLGNGHPSTPNWDPVTEPGKFKPVSSWEGWTRMLVPDEWTVRRWLPDVSKGIGSGRAPDESSIVVSLNAAGSRRTRLLPYD
ncbi:MAG: hypothetical protein HKN37_02040 [Rhodothermales bacterium]|nr:hypothetical protein [Rhodothermales bacterium]